MWHVLYVTCAVVGAVVLYSALTAAAWVLTVRLVRRRAHRRARAQAAAAAMPVAGDRRARSWEELPGWLWRDRPWAVAVVLLGAPAVRERTGPYVDFTRRTIDWPGLLAASAGWPPDQRLLVMTAHELAFDTVSEVEQVLSEPVTLHDMVQLLDDDEVRRIQLAISVRRGRVQPNDALTQLGA